MLEIKGKVNTAVCYASVIEWEAIEQIRKMCDCEFTRDASIRIMPDVHAGKGCTIGTTMTVHDRIVPNIVGVDIGCGMYTVELEERELDFRRIDEAAHFIPSGHDVWEHCQEPFDLTRLLCFRRLRELQRLKCSLGTLGGGNHFIEIDRSADGTNYLVIHSGSRNLGVQVAEYYQSLAVELQSGREDLAREKQELIKSLKKQGRRDEIQQALKDLDRNREASRLPVDKDLCWLYGPYLQAYLHDVEICQEFARKSREKMARIMLERCGLTACSAFHTIHNYIDTKEMILRKGAIAAHQGEVVLIPINMRDGSILARGKGNPDWNYSAPHGAGRIMSRSRAKEELDVEDYRRAMEGVYTTCVGQATLDESPMAYKSLEDILEVVQESVEIIEVLKPVYNFKA